MTQSSRTATPWPARDKTHQAQMAEATVLIEDLRRRGLVCPLPKQWHDMYQILFVHNFSTAPNPLILAAWHHTSREEKRQRLALQIRSSCAEGFLVDVAICLTVSLKAEDWLLD